ncbi:MAG: DUF3806 domain-containing protein [Phycicoccus sp.]
MGILDRLRRRDDDPADTTAGDPWHPTSAVAEPVAEEEEGIRRLHADEEATLDRHRAHYPDHDIDPADLTSVARAYERALDGVDDAPPTSGPSSSAAVAVIATALGDHLVRAGGYRWVVCTDPFGTDLAVEPPRSGVPVVPRTLVAVRWMQRDRGWVTGVVEHLARAGRR